MSKPRYIALNHDTYGEVVDLTTGNQVSRHALIRDAEAEAARLNAEAPRRAVAAKAWCAVTPEGQFSMPTLREHANWSRDVVDRFGSFTWADCEANGWRIARVRIEEIEE
jgi:hypothetical protein